MFINPIGEVNNDNSNEPSFSNSLTTAAEESATNFALPPQGAPRMFHGQPGGTPLQLIPAVRPGAGSRFPSPAALVSSSASSASSLPQDQRQQLLAAFNAHPAVAELRHWLNEAPKRLVPNGGTGGQILSYTLGSQETISCVLWKGRHYITGTDIVKILRFRFACMGRPMGNAKKFEEGVFSDLRNLKSGEHATLEEPKSEFLEFLYKHNCIRTQKKQKVFYWYEVRHDDLVVEAFERDAKRHNQAANINSFLRSHQQTGFHQQQQQQYQQTMMMGGASPRLMPRPGMSPISMLMNINPHHHHHHPQQHMVSGYPSPLAMPMAWEMPPSSDPAVDFIESELEDHLSSLPDREEPAAKSPRLAAPGSIDPSLISALPAKVQRRVRQQVQAVSKLNSPCSHKAMAPREEVKDPLLLDPFGFESSGDLFIDSLFPAEDYEGSPAQSSASDLFMLNSYIL